MCQISPQNKHRKSVDSAWAYECPNPYCYRGALSCYRGALDPFLPISRIHFTWLPGKIKRDILEKWTAAHICFKLKQLTYVLRLWRKKPLLEHSLLRAADKNSTKTGNIKNHSAWFDEANLSKDSLTRGGPHRRATQ